MSDRIIFGAFDPTADVAISQRRLPHWFQPGVATFITFRTADSLPTEVLRRWEREQADWLARNVRLLIERGELPSDIPIPSSESLREGESPPVPARLQSEFQRRRWEAWHNRLDECHGECVLRQREYATTVADSVRKFDGKRYDVDSLVVMPNHVHVLLQFNAGCDLRKQVGEWQRFSARAINARRGRSGVFWQREPFDHLVRSAEQFSYLQRYIAENPQRARLPVAAALYWRRDG